MLVTADLVWTDHPAWCVMPTATARVVTVDGDQFVAFASQRTLDVVALTEADPSAVAVDIYTWPRHVTASPLVGIGSVARVRATDLWEAIGAAVCHHPDVVEPQRVYKRLCRHLGEAVPLPSSPQYRHFPTAHVIAEELPVTLRGAGLGDQATILRDAARSYLQHRHQWRASTPSGLVEALESAGLDEGTARRAAADHTGDYSIYPHDDHFRRLAERALPHHWPAARRDFTASWTNHTGHGLSDVTAILLAWADHR